MQIDLQKRLLFALLGNEYTFISNIGR